MNKIEKEFEIYCNKLFTNAKKPKENKGNKK